jgi:NADH-quinone oxidoreductase subunit N
MSKADFTVLMPAIIVLTTSLLVILQTVVKRNQSAAMVLTVGGLVGSLVSLDRSAELVPYVVDPLLILDGYGLFFAGLILVSALVTSLLGFSYLKRQQENGEEFYIVLLLSVLGALALVFSDHFISLFLGLELMTVSLYVMIAYLRDSKICLEAGVKYLILAAASSAFLLFGLALLYADLGTMKFAEVMAASADSRQVFLLIGVALFLVGAGFKLALVPFHMWTPDVYEGAPAPVTGFIATVSKAAVFALLLRYFFATGAHSQVALLSVLSIIEAASMLIGNILALLQRNVKRLLAYSSIAHLGYILVALIAGGGLALEAVAYYLVAYSVTILAAFGIISALSSQEGEPGDIEDYRGLFWSRPWIAMAFTAVLLSLGGIPLTAGFVGKFMAILAGADASLWTLLVILAITSLIGIYYYLRIVTAMYRRSETESKVARIELSFTGQLVLTALVFFVIYFGVYPSHLMTIISNTVLRISW